MANRLNAKLKLGMTLLVSLSVMATNKDKSFAPQTLLVPSCPDPLQSNCNCHMQTKSGRGVNCESTFGSMPMSDLVCLRPSLKSMFCQL